MVPRSCDRHRKTLASDDEEKESDSSSSCEGVNGQSDGSRTSEDSDDSTESSSDDSETDERKSTSDGNQNAAIDFMGVASTNAESIVFFDFMGVASTNAESSTNRSVQNENPDNEQPLVQLPIAAEASPVGVKRRKPYRRKKDKPKLMWEIWEEENEQWIDEHLTDDTNIEQKERVMTETAEAPADVIVPLLRYQKEWLAWALKQEESPAKGGILADEMGMGKTLQAIALVLAKRDILQKACKYGDPSSSVDVIVSTPTLVVCPVVAVSQWVSEIGHFTRKGSTNVLVYHGVNREKNLNNFSWYDFVITTYGTLEAEFRKSMMPSKKKCPHCGKSFNDDKLSTHLKYFCGPDSNRTEKQSKQYRKKCKSVALKSLQEAGSDQDMSVRSQISILHSVRWGRIILDEAHYVKDRQRNSAKAVFSLESSYKWALSGTPIQNRVGELYSLVRFLQIVPYSHYICKDCNCQTLVLRRAALCENCPHRSFRHFCWWNRYISNPILSYGTRERGRRAMILLKTKVLRNILLRRTKKGRAADLALPPRTVVLRCDALDVKEQDYYQSLYNESQAKFNTYVNSGTLMNNYAHIFDLLTRLRQAVDHPYLVEFSKAAVQKGDNSIDSQNVEQVCGLCHDPVEDPVVVSCSHVFCKGCLLDFSASLGQVSCPTCSCLLTVDFTTNVSGGDQVVKPKVKGYKSSSILNRIQLNDFQTSTKIEALREEIRGMVERDGSAKGIVFSQFTSFLDLISYALSQSGVKCVQLVGSMTLSQRDAAIKTFTEDPDCRIFLLSLKAGGVALNLTVASHVFLMDPWWNPAAERQAQDRIHRIGQYKPIRIVRFVIKNTVEERILKLQDKKELVFEGTVGGSSEAIGKLTERDLRFLFGN